MYINKPVSCCSGTFKLDYFTIVLLSKEPNILSFPQPSQKEVDAAIQNAKKSGFGKNKQNVIDESYRLAYQYLPHELGLPSALVQKIIQEVTKQISNIMGSQREVKTELIKLNIYPKGGLFKKHVDSPKKDAFGSLVVFLPCYFQGGDLIVEENNEKNNFSFGGVKKQKNLNWVAFYNDSVHQITEVTYGCRMTLSYNLYYGQEPVVKVFPKSELVDQLSLLQKNQVYGYYCQYYYGNNFLKDASNKLKNKKFLKGSDYELYLAAEAIGAKNITIKVVYRKKFQTHIKFDQFWIKQHPIKEKEQLQKSVLKKLKDDYYQIRLIGQPQKIQRPFAGWCDSDDGQFYVEQYIQCIQPKLWVDYEKVKWLNKASSKSSYTYAFKGYYGNHYEVEEQYCQLILLIQL